MHLALAFASEFLPYHGRRQLRCVSRACAVARNVSLFELFLARRRARLGFRRWRHAGRPVRRVIAPRHNGFLEDVAILRFS